MLLLGEVDEGNFKHVYFWNIDRLSRNRPYSAIIQDKFEKNGVTLHTKSGSRDLTDSHDKLLLDLLRAVATFDNELRTERFRLGKLAKIRQGFWIGGSPPYGYDLGTNKKLVVNKEESKWVKEIFTLYNKGYSPDRIRAVLLDNNVVTKRGKVIWSDGSVSSVLRNTHYIGHYDYVDKKTGEKIRSNCPTIITTKTYQKYLEVSKKRQKRKGQTTYSGRKLPHLLDGIGHCGYCDSFLTTGKNVRTRFYQCRGYWRKYRSTVPNEKFCEFKRTLRLDLTDELVWNAVVDVLSESNLYKETIKLAILPSDKEKELTKKNNKNTEDKIKRLRKELETIQDAITKQHTTRLLVENTKQIDAIIKELEKRELETKSNLEDLQETLDNVTTKEKWIDWYLEFGNKIQDLRTAKLTVEQQNEFLKGVVESITVKEKDKTTHSITIKFKEPFVDDRLEWINVKRKSLGYKVTKGKTKKTINGVLSLKKSSQKQ